MVDPRPLVVRLPRLLGTSEQAQDLVATAALGGVTGRVVEVRARELAHLSADAATELVAALADAQAVTLRGLHPQYWPLFEAAIDARVGAPRWTWRVGDGALRG